MTVAELIEHLKGYDPTDKIVLTASDADDTEPFVALDFVLKNFRSVNDD